MALVPSRTVKTPSGKSRAFEAKYDEQFDQFKDLGPPPARLLGARPPPADRSPVALLLATRPPATRCRPLPARHRPLPAACLAPIRLPSWAWTRQRFGNE